MARTVDRKVEALATSPLGRRCDRAELRRLASAGDLFRAPAGTTFHGARDLHRWAYVVLDGAVVLTDDSTPLAVAGAGSWFPLGPPARTHRSALTALDDAEVLTFRWREVAALVEDIPRLAS